MLRGASKTFGPQVALDRIDLDIAPGEIRALVGQNGCGKSTLVKILAGYHEPDPGSRAEVAGRAFALGSATASQEAGLRFVHQDLGLVDHMTVSDNFRLSAGGRRLGLLRRTAERAAASRALASLGYDISPTALVSTLAESERTAVAVARALDRFQGVPLIVLDEPTASLPGPEVERLFAALRRLADNGTAILFISHHLDEVLGLADHVTVLRDGRKIATTPVGELSHDTLVELMLGRQLMSETALHELVRDDAAKAPRLVTRLLAGESVVGLDLEVHPGHVLGIAGLTGSGREEVAGLIAGRLPRRGTVEVDGKVVAPGAPDAAIRADISYVPADRAAHALLPLACVRENVTLVDLKPFWLKAVLRKKVERREAERWVDELDVRPPSTEKVVTELSGGNQQKIVMARWLRIRPAVLVLDEPPRGWTSARRPTSIAWSARQRDQARRWSSARPTTTSWPGWPLR